MQQENQQHLYLKQHQPQHYAEVLKIQKILQKLRGSAEEDRNKLTLINQIQQTPVNIVPNPQKEKSNTYDNQQMLIQVDAELYVKNEEPFLAIIHQLKNTIGLEQQTIWHRLANLNKGQLIQLLLDNQLFLGQLNAKDRNGLKPVEVAAMHCQQHVVQKMLLKGAKGFVLYWASRFNNPIKIYYGDHTDGDGNSAVHHAAASDNTQILQLLYKREGMQALSRKNKRGLTPLGLAIDQNSYGAVCFLLQTARVQPESESQILEQSNSLYIKQKYSQMKELWKKKDQMDQKARNASLQEHSHEEKQPCCKSFAKLLMSYSHLLAILSWQLLFLPLYYIESSLLILMLFLTAISYIIDNREEGDIKTFRRLLYKTSFFKRKIFWGQFHKFYLIFLGTALIQSLSFAYLSLFESGWYFALTFWVNAVSSFLFGVSLVINGVCIIMNLTMSQMLSRWECEYLFSRVQVLQDRAVHKFHNPYDQGIWNNLSFYQQL